MVTPKRLSGLFTSEIKEVEENKEAQGVAFSNFLELKAIFLGVSDKDYVSLIEYDSNGKNDWCIRITGLNEFPQTVQITGEGQDVWKYPTSPKYAIIYAVSVEDGIELYFEPATLPKEFVVHLTFKDSSKSFVIPVT